MIARVLRLVGQLPVSAENMGHSLQQRNFTLSFMEPSTSFQGLWDEPWIPVASWHISEAMETPRQDSRQITESWAGRCREEVSYKTHHSERSDGKLTRVVNITPRKTTVIWQWKITIFNRRYIFKWLFFHCHLSFRDTLWTGTAWRLSV